MLAPVPTLLDGEPFDDWDSFLYEYEDGLSRLDKEAIYNVTHGKCRSAYIGGGHLPVWFICAMED